MHVVTPTDKSKVKKFIRGILDAYDEYGRYKPVWYLGMDVVGTVRKEISYGDSLKKGY